MLHGHQNDRGPDRDLFASIPDRIRRAPSSGEKLAHVKLSAAANQEELQQLPPFNGDFCDGRAQKKLSYLCLDCHLDRTSPLEHKVDIVPKMEVLGLPLADGKVTYVTCHDLHANIHGSMLRLRPADLCPTCHPM